jgi:flagellar hook-length control protein FliK
MESVDGEPAFDGADPDDRPLESPNALGVTPLSLLPATQAPLAAGPQGPAPALAETTHSLPPGALTDWIQQTVSDLKVFEGNVGTSQVRLDIKPELLPGVRVIVQEAGGRIQVDFICSAESSRRLLGAVARREATDMARRCRRDLLLRVQSEEDDSNPRSGTDPDAVEIVAAA